MRFKEFLISEESAGGMAPPGGPGMSPPGGSDLGATPGGTVPPAGGPTSLPGMMPGAMPGDPAGGMGGMPPAGGGGSLNPQVNLQMKDLDVWSILRKLLDGKEESGKDNPNLLPSRPLENQFLMK